MTDKADGKRRLVPPPLGFRGPKQLLLPPAAPSLPPAPAPAPAERAKLEFGTAKLEFGQRVGLYKT